MNWSYCSSLCFLCRHSILVWCQSLYFYLYFLYFISVRDSDFLHYTHQVDVTHMWDHTQRSRSWTKTCSLGSHNMYYYCIIEPKAQLRVLLRGRLGPQGLSTCRGMLGQETKPQTLLMAVPTVCQWSFPLDEQVAPCITDSAISVWIVRVTADHINAVHSIFFSDFLATDRCSCFYSCYRA